jgi:hypothetical protein
MRITPTWRHHVRAKRRFKVWVKRAIARPQPTAMTALPKALHLSTSHRFLPLRRRTANAAAMTVDLFRHLSSPIAKGFDYKITRALHQMRREQSIARWFCWSILWDKQKIFQVMASQVRPGSTQPYAYTELRESAYVTRRRPAYSIKRRTLSPNVWLQSLPVIRKRERVVGIVGALACAPNARTSTGSGFPL